ncbi:MAG: dockerin type I repeat-containing protein [Phycisphaerae bacterium]
MIVILSVVFAASLLHAQPCPIVDRGSPLDGITTISVIQPEGDCTENPLFAGWRCMVLQSEANDNGVQYGIDVRWNLVTGPVRGSFTWLKGGGSTESIRLSTPLAVQVQDTLETTDHIRTIELRYLGLGTQTPPRNGFVNISSTYADVLEFLITHGIARGVVGHYGNSGGSMMGANAVSYHNLDLVLDGIVYGGGPFWSDLQAVCTEPDSPIFGDPLIRSRVDDWNWLELGGAPFCSKMLPQSVPPYTCRSTLGIEANTVYPNTIVSVIVGTEDNFNPWMDASATDYWQNINAQAKTFDRPVAPHLIVASEQGAATLYQRIVDIVNAQSPPIIGDINCDGVLNIDDRDALVLALLDPVAFQTIFPVCNINRADLNGDGLINGKDIQPFLTLLVNF